MIFTSEVVSSQVQSLPVEKWATQSVGCGPVAAKSAASARQKSPAKPGDVHRADELSGVAAQASSGAGKDRSRAKAASRAPAQGQLHVTEPWRIPERPDLDVLQGTEPARVIGDHVPCTKRGGDTPTRAAMTRMTTSLARDLGTGPSAGSSAFGEAAYGQAMEALDTGTSLGDLAAHHATTAWAPETTGAQCRGAILRSPVGSRMPASLATSTTSRRRRRARRWLR